MNNRTIRVLQGYAGGDEPRMLRRRLSDTSAKVGVGANRAAVAYSMLQKHGYIHHSETFLVDKKLSAVSEPESGKIGVAILDDGMQVYIYHAIGLLFKDKYVWQHSIWMKNPYGSLLTRSFGTSLHFRQHWSLLRDVEIVMINGLLPWGNTHFIPRGPMREPLSALGRADIVVIHNADLVCVNGEITRVHKTLLLKCSFLVKDSRDSLYHCKLNFCMMNSQLKG
jgi:tetraacyldisaccharide 4'-kinase